VASLLFAGYVCFHPAGPGNPAKDLLFADRISTYQKEGRRLCRHERILNVSESRIPNTRMAGSAMVPGSL